jgi:inner membrane protein
VILAHLPAGYLVGRAFGVRSGPVMAAALAGSVLPDLDLIWFYLIDDRAFHHHRYWVHIPAFWAMVAGVALPLVRLLAPGMLRPALALIAVILVHIVLDSIGGGILWFWPFDGTMSVLVEAPATQSHWVLSFLVHWTFALEAAIMLTAAALFLAARKAPE